MYIRVYVCTHTERETHTHTHTPGFKYSLPKANIHIYGGKLNPLSTFNIFSFLSTLVLFLLLFFGFLIPYLFYEGSIVFLFFRYLFQSWTAWEAFRHGFYSVILAPNVYIDYLLCICHTFICLLPWSTPPGARERTKRCLRGLRLEGGVLSGQSACQMRALPWVMYARRRRR